MIGHVVEFARLLLQQKKIDSLDSLQHYVRTWRRSNNHIDLRKYLSSCGLHDVSIEYLCLLYKADALVLLPAIARAVDFLTRDTLMHVTVTTTVQLNNSNKALLVDKMSTKYPTHKFVYKYIVDPKIVLGIIIQENTLMIDGSIVSIINE